MISFKRALRKFNQLPAVTQGKQTSSVLKVSSKGPDKKQLNKLGIEVDELEKLGIQYKPDHAYLHIVTTGAGEFFGPNLKGDYFHESPKTVSFPEPVADKARDLGPGLKDCHHTFRTSDGIYRHHKYDTPPQGDIVWERYYNPMHRGEVIAALPLSMWEDDLHRYASGQPLLWSQGSSVKSDICSYCGYEFTAQSPSRCSHMKNNKLAVMPDGTQVYVYNPSPRFYELSEVGSRPAAKIAFCLRKVADDSDVEEVSSQIVIPRQFLADVCIVPDKSRKEKILRKMAEEEKRIQIIVSPKDSEVAKGFRLSDEDMNDIRNRLKDMEWAELLPALQKSECMLSPSNFHAILSDIEPENMPGVEEFEEAVSTVYSDALDSGNSCDILEDTSYSSRPYPVLQSALSSVEPVKKHLSLSPPSLAVRSLRNKDKPGIRVILIKKGSEVSPQAAFLAREYAKYQTEFLAEQGKDENIYLAAVCNQTK